MSETEENPAKTHYKSPKYTLNIKATTLFVVFFIVHSWEQRKLGDTVQITMGQSPDGSTYSDVPSDYILVQGNADLQNGWVSPRVWTSQMTKKAEAGDLIMSVRAPAGAMGKTAYNVVIGRGVAAIKGNEFIYQLLVKMDSDGYWKALSCGSTFESLNSDNIKNADVLIPDISEQEKIGTYFANLDRLITLHQRKEFCHFSRFREQKVVELLAISWEQCKLGALGSVAMCRRIFKEQTSSKGDIPFYKIGTFGGEADAFITRELFEEYKAKYPYPCDGAVLISASGSIGRTVVYSGENAYFQDSNIVWLAHDDRITDSFLKHLYGVIRWAGIEGSTIKRLYNDNILKTEIFLPPMSEQRKIANYLDSIDNLITLHQCEYFSQFHYYTHFAVQRFNVNLTHSWEQRKLGDLVERVVRKNTNNESTLPLTISAQYGLVDQITYFNNRVASRDVSNYYLVLNGEFAYNKSTSDGFPFGAVKRLDLYEKGVLSTLYIVFSIKNQAKTNSNFLTVLFDTDRWHKGVSERATEGARNHGLLNISAEDFFDIDLCLPKSEQEQAAIGAYFKDLDSLITLHQRKYVQKRLATTHVIFDKKIRKLTRSWEQRKLSEIADFYTGNGLSWNDISEKGNKECILYGNLYTDYGMITDTVVYRTDAEIKSPVYSEFGDVLIPASDTTPTGLARATSIEKSGVLLGGDINIVRPKNGINGSCLSLAINANKSELIKLIKGTTVRHIHNSEIQGVTVSLPDELREQEIITDYFKNLDRLITLHQCKDLLQKICFSCQKKINKKDKNHTSWEQRKLSEIADFSKGQGYTKSDLRETGTPIILYGRLYTKYQSIISEVDTFADEISGAVKSKGGEVILPSSGETAEDIAIAASVEKSGVLLGGGLNIVLPHKEIESAFLAIEISYGTPHNELAKQAQGKSIVHLYNEDLKKVVVSYPSAEEQRKITSVFDNLDRLITLHQRIKLQLTGEYYD